MIKALAHLCFTVKDLEASIVFYRDQLGLTPAFDFINEQGVRHGCYLHIGGRSFIELFQGDYEEPKGGSYRHFCLEVEDIQGTVADLRAKGVEVTDVQMGGDNSWQAWLKDPDGNRIELHHYTENSKQHGPWME